MRLIQIAILFTITFTSCRERESDDRIKVDDIKSDIEYLDKFISEYSSYSGLNGYDYKNKLDSFLKYNDNKVIDKNEFGLFLTKVIGRIGDRHAYLKGYDFPNTKFFPFAFAPHKGRVLVLKYVESNRNYDFVYSEYPVLKSIDGIPVDDLLPQILPEETLAPESAYFTRAVRKLRDIEEVFSQLGKEITTPLKITLSNNKEDRDTTIQVPLVNKKKKINKWDEKFYRQFFHLSEEDFNQKEVIVELFNFEDSIGYFRIPDMVSRDEAPELYLYFNQFMRQIENKSQALIIDVRSNGGGVRDLIYELAGYFVHPDSIYVVNAVRQRGELPLNEDFKQDLHNRYLFAAEELDGREEMAVKKFNSVFEPIYDLDNTKYSQFHFAILNGKKLSKDKFYYEKPIYVLANERSFSAASLLVTMLKGLPNIKIVGVTTDGSSGNSERFELPQTEFRGKISTMVSFQKNGKILDGYGTQPDIEIERDLNQIQWKSDTQLEEVIEIIKTVPNK